MPKSTTPTQPPAAHQPSVSAGAASQAPLVDVVAAARAGQALQGQTPLAALTRLLDLAQAPSADALVHWQAEFAQRSGSDGRAQAWLNLHLHTQVVQTCQRCLAPATLALQADPVFRFVATEAQAEREDEASAEDLLVLSKRFDLAELIEDELLLALPLVALHETCPQPLATPDPVPVAGVVDASPPAPHPFAALSKLRGSL